ncbi:hypothetical protein AX16_000657 [Volvariella volvacea WC 439]|nr:hypothetical protein AX16_000657 [Volvariella volvacea WC 439]
MSYFTIQPSITSLPNELILEICSFLDEPSLICFAKANRYLNRLCICGLQHNWMGFDYAPDIAYASFNMAALNPGHRGVIAISIAFLTLTVSFSSELARLMEELSFVNQIVSNQASIVDVTLKIKLRLHSNTGSMAMWWNSLVRLIENALGRGCRVLKLKIKVSRWALPVKHSSELQLSVLQRWNELSRLEVCGDILLEDPFIQWTLDLLSCSPILLLTFGSINQAPESWYRLLRSSDLHCRNLQDLYIYCEIPWDDLKAFLSHHEDLHTLVIVPNKVDSTNQSLEAINSLRALKILDIHPVYGSCLLPSIRPGDQLWFCTIRLDGTLTGITSLMTTLGNLSIGDYISPDGKVHIETIKKEDINGLETWFHNIHDYETLLPRPFSPRIHHLCFRLQYGFEPNPSQYDTLKHFCSFFPELKTLDLSCLDYDGWNATSMNAFWLELAKVCPLFKEGTIGGNYSWNRQVSSKEAP